VTDVNAHDQRRIVVLEREPFWEPELKRQFSGAPVVVRGCRKDLESLVSTAENCVAVIDASRDTAEVLRWSARRLTNRRCVPTVIVAEPDIMSFQWHAREAGVIAVVPHVISAHELARLCRKQWPAELPEKTHTQTADSSEEQ